MHTILLSISTLLTSWQFAFEQQDHQLPAAQDKAWQEVTVPHDWAIYGPFDRKNDLQNVTVWQNGETFPSLKTGRSGGLPYMGSAWYKTTIQVPSLDSQVSLLFDGAMSEAEVYVNGEKAGYWPYGYNAFHVDITSFLREGENEIAACKTESNQAVGIPGRVCIAMCTLSARRACMCLYGARISRRPM